MGSSGSAPRSGCTRASASTALVRDHPEPVVRVRFRDVRILAVNGAASPGTGTRSRSSLQLTLRDIRPAGGAGPARRRAGASAGRGCVRAGSVTGRSRASDSTWNLVARPSSSPAARPLVLARDVSAHASSRNSFGIAEDGSRGSAAGHRHDFNNPTHRHPGLDPAAAAQHRAPTPGEDAEENPPRGLRAAELSGSCWRSPPAGARPQRCSSPMPWSRTWTGCCGGCSEDVELASRSIPPRAASTPTPGSSSRCS